MTILPYLLKQAAIDMRAEFPNANQEYIKDAWRIVVGGLTPEEYAIYSKDAGGWAQVKNDISDLSHAIAAAQGNLSHNVVSSKLTSLMTNAESATYDCLKCSATRQVTAFYQRASALANEPDATQKLEELQKDFLLLQTVPGQAVLEGCKAKDEFIQYAPSTNATVQRKVVEAVHAGYDAAIAKYQSDHPELMDAVNTLWQSSSKKHTPFSPETIKAMQERSVRKFGTNAYLTGGLGGALAMAPLALMSKNPLMLMALGGLLGCGYQYGRGQGWWNGAEAINKLVDNGSDWMDTTFMSDEEKRSKTTMLNDIEKEEAEAATNEPMNVDESNSKDVNPVAWNTTPTKPSLETKETSVASWKGPTADTSVASWKGPTADTSVDTNNISNESLAFKAPAHKAPSTSKFTEPKAPTYNSTPMLQEVPQLV